MGDTSSNPTIKDIYWLYNHYTNRDLVCFYYYITDGDYDTPLCLYIASEYLANAK